jgi:hypothetical protein
MMAAGGGENITQTGRGSRLSISDFRFPIFDFRLGFQILSANPAHSALIVVRLLFELPIRDSVLRGQPVER